MIKIKNLDVKIKNKQILKKINIDFETGKNYLLIWKNWSWKSTLCSFLMWHPKYKHAWGEIIIDWDDLLWLCPRNRSLKWLFLSFQNIPEIKWVKLWEYLRTIYNIHYREEENKSDFQSLDKINEDVDNNWCNKCCKSNQNKHFKWLTPLAFKKFIKSFLQELSIEESFLGRELNVWFSGWEKRKIEILQMRLIWPKYIILDEIDSWLDLDAFKTIAKLLKNISTKENSLIIVTHNFDICDYIDIDEVHVIDNWKIVKKWGKEVIWEINKQGFENL